MRSMWSSAPICNQILSAAFPQRLEIVFAADRLSSETIVHALADSEDRPWPERLPLTKAQLARLLVPFGIRPTIVHRSRTQVSRGYLASDFADAFARYLPHQPIL